MSVRAGKPSSGSYHTWKYHIMSYLCVRCGAVLRHVMSRLLKRVLRRVDLQAMKNTNTCSRRRQQHQHQQDQHQHQYQQKSEAGARVYMQVSLATPTTRCRTPSAPCWTIPQTSETSASISYTRKHATAAAGQERSSHDNAYHNSRTSSRYDQAYRLVHDVPGPRHITRKLL